MGPGMGLCTGKGGSGVLTRAPPPRLPVTVGVSGPWPRPLRGLSLHPPRAADSSDEPGSEGTECHAQTHDRAGDPSRPLRRGHWGHWDIRSRHSSWPSTRAAASVRVVDEGRPSRPQAGPQANLLILFSLGWEVRLLALFGVPGAPHHSPVPSALPAGWCPHPFSQACSISNPSLAHLNHCGRGVDASGQASTSLRGGRLGLLGVASGGLRGRGGRTPTCLPGCL